MGAKLRCVACIETLKIRLKALETFNLLEKPNSMFRRHKRSNSASQPATGVGRAKSMERCQSLPSSLDNIKGIMKHVTLDQSLHSKYGETKEGEERRNIQFKDLLIREYARTVGDNPSCSSGPPIS